MFTSGAKDRNMKNILYWMEVVYMAWNVYKFILYISICREFWVYIYFFKLILTEDINNPHILDVKCYQNPTSSVTDVSPNKYTASV